MFGRIQPISVTQESTIRAYWQVPICGDSSMRLGNKNCPAEFGLVDSVAGCVTGRLGNLELTGREVFYWIAIAIARDEMYAPWQMSHTLIFTRSQARS